MRHGTGDWREFLPTSRGARTLLGVGAVSLLAGIPMLWMWLLYGSGLPQTTILAAAIALAAVTVGTGAAMIRALDEGE